MNHTLPAIALTISFVVSPLLNAETEKSYELKNRSTFAAAQDCRAPFWPIGWAKRAKGAAGPVAAPVAKRAPIEASQFKITSVLLGDPSLAVINGRAYGEGEFLRQQRAPAGQPPFPRVRVQQIAEGQVVLECDRLLLTIPFHRPEVATSRPELGLLSEER